MRFILLLLSIISILSITILSCGDTIYPENMAKRYVYEVSEADITGHGGYIDITELVGITGTGSEKEMPVVMVYGDKRSQGISWEPLSGYAYHLEEGKIFIETTNGNSYYYRIVVIK